MKMKKNFNLGKLSDKLDKMYVAALNDLGSRLNKAIQDNINAGGDPKFEPLKDSTKRLGGKEPLNRTGKLKKGVKKTPATASRQRFMLEISTKYGGLHHTGYVTAPGSKIPNKKVPARKWFIIPKSIQPGGEHYNKMMTTLKARIVAGWKSK